MGDASVLGVLGSTDDHKALSESIIVLRKCELIPLTSGKLISLS
jgi:hypothetical protein